MSSPAPIVAAGECVLRSGRDRVQYRQGGVHFILEVDRNPTVVARLPEFGGEVARGELLSDEGVKDTVGGGGDGVVHVHHIPGGFRQRSPRYAACATFSTETRR